MKSIGRYQLLERLGQGGMGVVYRAFDTLLERVVAVKLISGSIDAGPEQRERFFREARAAGQLSHRNIITIHDLGEHDGQPYLAMEYLEGEDLQRRLAGANDMSLARKVELAMEICEGLDYAHARGIVHRDIKPANIFITDSGTAKLLDFGLARLVSSELTGSNMMMGTINYMAPEQVRGERADRRSDIFSAGVVFYELLGWRKAFAGDSFAATLFKILQDVPEPLANIDPSLPHGLIAVVDRALTKPRDDRYQYMADMRRDLAECWQQLVGFESPSGTRPVLSGYLRLTEQPHPRPPSQLNPASDAPTIASETTPFPSAPPAATQPGALQPTAPSAAAGTPAVPAAPVDAQGGSIQPAPRSARQLWMVGAAVVLVLAALGLWAARSSRPQPPPPDPSTAPAQAAVDPVAVANAVSRATQAFEAGNFSEAERLAGAALALDPNQSEARRIRERAAATAERVSSGLREARAHYDAGRFDEASRAAGNVLSVAPREPEARELMQNAAVRSRGRGADEARARVTQARSAARAADAATLATPAYNAAVEAERAARGLYEAGHLADATAKYYEASGLFRSAELSAQAEAARRAASAAAANAGRAEPERTTTQAQDTRPPVVNPTDLPPRTTAELPPPAPPATRGSNPAPGEETAAPAPPPPAPSPPAAPAPSEPSAESVIGQLLAQYEAALETRDLGALKRLWPGLGGSQESAIRNEFQHASRIDVEIASPRITVGGPAATATFLRRYALVTIDGQRLTSQSRTTMTLQRTGAGWVIDGIRFDPVR